MSHLLLASLLLFASPVDDDVVARAGDVVLTRQTFAAWLVERVGYAHVDDALDELVILQAARASGHDPSVEEIQQAFDAQRAEIIERYYNGDPDAYRKDLVKKGYDPDAHETRQRLEMRLTLALRSLAMDARQIDEGALRKRYRDLYGDLGERTRLEVLFFSAYHGLEKGDERPPLAELKSQAVARASRAAEGLAQGRPLAELTAGSDPVASDFVEDGVIAQYRTRMLGLEVDRAVQSLDEPGDVTPVIPVWDGAYVLRLVERRSVTYEQARPELERLLREARPTSDEISAARDRIIRGTEREVFLR